MELSNFQSLLKTKKIIDERIRLFFDERKAWGGAHEKQMYSDLSEYCLRGGKRLRAFLLLLGYRFSSGEYNPAIYDVAFAFELMHAAALIHDDYIDNDVLRRGKPTFHMTVSKKKRKSRAIAAGNTLFGLSMEVLTNADFSEEIKLAAVQKYSKSALLTGFGEAMDVYHSYSFTPGKVIIEKILRLKTAQYTLSGPLTLGSLLAKGTSNEQKTLNEIGDNIGIAFQLADDILGATGPVEIGKDIGSDFREGKPTLFLQEAWKKMSLSEKLQARRLMQKSHLSDADISKLRESVVSKINLGEMDHMTKRYANTAKSMIEKLEVKDDIKHDLLLVAEFATQRKL